MSAICSLCKLSMPNEDLAGHLSVVHGVDGVETAPTHVVPENDEREHVTDGPFCPCMPRDMGPGVFIHNSYDGREIGEVCARALDVLGLALANRGHTWTANEREQYEHAHHVLAMHYEIKGPGENLTEDDHAAS